MNLLRTPTTNESVRLQQSQSLYNEIAEQHEA